MKKYKRKLMDSGQRAAALVGLPSRSKRSQLIIVLSLPLCVFMLAHLAASSLISAQAAKHADHHHRHQPSDHRLHHSNALKPDELRDAERRQLHAPHSCSHFEAASQQTRHRRHQFGLSRRQALESVVNRLHILESLDEQLRAFSEAAELAQRHHQQQAAIEHESDGHLNAVPTPVGTRAPSGRIFCQLKLFRSPLEAVGRQVSGSSCLANKRLLNQIPPYMLNLYRQLLFELHQLEEERARNATTFGSSTNFPSASETVQSMMPYNAQIMRSFRQPKLLLPAAASQQQGSPGRLTKRPQDYYLPEQEDSSLKEEEADQFGGWADVIVELSALEQAAYEAKSQLDSRPQGASSSVWDWPFESSSTAEPEPAFKWRHSTPSESQPATRLGTRQQRQQVAMAPELACDFRQRLLDASRRDEICFWFNLSESFRMRANKSLEFGGVKSSTGDTNGASERLLEAELHVFKLFPQLAGTPAGAATQPLEPINRSTSANSFHLKTNLLEVSLYQILRKRRTSASANRPANRLADQLKQRPANAAQLEQQQDEFPLRLLDIRRIDLNSNGWETFYVKRAVEDWLRDARLNLGLVIKAKSMFDEPIKVGLIRFADAYDHYARRPDVSNSSPLVEVGSEHGDHAQEPPSDQRLASGDDSGSASSAKASTGRRRQAEQEARAVRDFDTSHQPLLVIYTTTPAR